MAFTTLENAVWVKNDRGAKHHIKDDGLSKFGLQRDYLIGRQGLETWIRRQQRVFWLLSHWWTRPRWWTCRRTRLRWWTCSLTSRGEMLELQHAAVSQDRAATPSWPPPPSSRPLASSLPVAAPSPAPLRSSPQPPQDPAPLCCPHPPSPSTPLDAQEPSRPGVLLVLDAPRRSVLDSLAMSASSVPASRSMSMGRLSTGGLVDDQRLTGGGLLDICCFCFQALAGDYYFPVVLPQNRCNISGFTGHPNSKIQFEMKNIRACNLPGFWTDYRSSKQTQGVVWTSRKIIHL